MRLTSHQLAALTQAQHAPLRRVHLPGPGCPPWPAPAATLRALIRHGLVEQAVTRNRDGWPVDTWTITEAGVAALLPRPRRRVQRPRLLMALDFAHSTEVEDHEDADLDRGYTSRRDLALPDEPEAVDPADIVAGWAAAAAARHVDARTEEHLRREARSVGQQAREAVVRAHREGLHDELDELRRALANFNRRRRAGAEEAAA